MSFLSYAQNFEDVLLWRGLRDVKEGRYLDIGAQDPIFDSVSLSFYEAGWRGIHVEPTAYYAERLRNARPDETVIEAAVTDDAGPIEFFEIPNTGLSTGKAEIAERHSEADFPMRKVVVPCVRLDQLLEMFEQEIQWMKVDVEGMEADVLRSWGTSEKRPWLLVIESTLPNTLEPTEHLWAHEVVSRGYQEVYFDGLSRYFVHETQKQREHFFGPPANVFDGFEVSRNHFATRMLRTELEGAEQRLVEAQAEVEGTRSSLQEAELRLADECSRSARTQSLLEEAERKAEQERGLAPELRLELSLSEQRAAVEQSRANEIQARLEKAERQAEQGKDLAADLRRELSLSEQRVADERSRVTSLESSLADAEKAREATLAEHLEALQKLALAKSEHRSSIESLWRERQAAEQELRQHSSNVQAELRQALQDALATQNSVQIELARSGECEARLKECLAAAQLEASQQSANAERERTNLSSQLDRSVAELRHVQSLIRSAIADRPGFWERVRESLGLARPRPSWVALNSWTPSTTAPEGAANFSISKQMEYTMPPAVPHEGRNPLLKAGSLPELLSWNDIDFVRCAYVTLLGRQPDLDGEVYYTDRIRRGVSKLQILWQLRNSPEAKNHDPGIADLDRTLRQFRRAGLPVVGPLLSRRYADEWSQSERRTRRIENSVWRAHEAQRTRLAEIERYFQDFQDKSIFQPAEQSAPTEHEEISASSKSPLGISEPFRTGSTNQIAAEILSRFSRAAILNMRSKLSEL